MLTRTATRRSAAVLMVTLVAMLLVATAGSARAAQPRVSVGNGQVSATPHAGRHAAVIPPAPHDQTGLHLDLTSTPPADTPAPTIVVVEFTAGAETTHTAGDVVARVGRAPPGR